MFEWCTKATPSGASTRESSARYESRTSCSTWTSESSVIAKSIEPSATIGSVSPSFTCVERCGTPAKRWRQAAMHSSERSTATSSSHRSLRKCVQRPKPGAISRIRPVGTKARMRGKTVVHHCASGLPHERDHSSPRSCQLYAPSQPERFSETLGNALNSLRIGRAGQDEAGQAGKRALQRLAAGDGVDLRGEAGLVLRRARERPPDG